MRAVRLQHGDWEVECLPTDGARLSLLRYAGRDLLTGAPAHFRPPTRDFGEYETRPVYGYDDCFPSVDSGDFPEHAGMRVRDHGELCWLPWDVSATGSRLDCRARSEILPALHFRRSLIFADKSITWEFEVLNEGTVAVPFLHVMHALMPLDEVVALEFPAFRAIVDEMNDAVLDLSGPRQCAEFLLTRPRGTAEMLLLRDLSARRAAVTFKNGLELEVAFPPKLFPTLGIWWNNGGYPDENGCRRVECALEPIPGTSSSLAKAYREGTHLTAPPGGRASWQVIWSVRRQ
jgi:hypothetical protein